MIDYKLVPNLQQIVTEALVGMVSGVTQMAPPADEPLPDFIQAPIDRAVTRIRSEIDLHAAAAPAPVERNQCDGCQAGIPVENGMHRMGKPDGYADLMACAADRYGAAPAVQGEPVGAMNLAYELGGLEDGSYHLEVDELERVIHAARQDAQGELAVESSVIAGALFDFIGFLTTRDESTAFGATSLAAPAVDLLSQWAETRKLHLDGADVEGWQDRICTTPPTPPAVTKPDVDDLTEALRQYQHNDGSGLVFGYDRLLVDQYVAQLVEALELIEKGEDTGPDGWGAFRWADCRNIARAALAAHRKQGGDHV